MNIAKVTVCNSTGDEDEFEDFRSKGGADYPLYFVNNGESLLGNASLVDFAGADVDEEDRAWLDGMHYERRAGILVEFEDDAEQIPVVVNRLLERGYLVCGWQDHLLAIPSDQRLLEIAVRDCGGVTPEEGKDVQALLPRVGYAAV